MTDAPTAHDGLHDALRALAEAGGTLGMDELAEQLGFDLCTMTWDRTWSGCSTSMTGSSCCLATASGTR